MTMSVFERNDKIKELYKKYQNGKIKIVAGLRRCGKTYLLDTLFYDFINKKEHFSESSFKSIYLAGQHKDSKNEESFRLLLNSSAGIDTKIIFIDEVQEAENYYQVLKDFAFDHPKIDLYITGSNSNTLSADIVECFKELADIVYLFPLTFKEIRRVKRKYPLLDYLKYGGLPTVVNAKDKETELESIYKDVYQLDILDRVKKEAFTFLSKDDMDAIMENLFSSSTPFSTVEVVNRMCARYDFDNYQKAQLRKEVKDYLDIVTKSFLFDSFENDTLDRRTPLERIGLNKKYYCSDCGIAYKKCNVAIHKLTVALETAVHLHMKQCKIQTTGLLLLGSKNNVEGEIDFNYPGNHIQVTYLLKDENYKSEVGNLLAIDDECQKKVICVETNIDNNKIDKGITVIKAEDFLTKT